MKYTLEIFLSTFPNYYSHNDDLGDVMTLLWPFWWLELIITPNGLWNWWLGPLNLKVWHDQKWWLRWWSRHCIDVSFTKSDGMTKMTILTMDIMGVVTHLDILTNDQIFIWKPVETIKICSRTLPKPCRSTFDHWWLLDSNTF